MSVIAAAIGTAAVAGIAGAAISADAARKSANTQADAALAAGDKSTALGYEQLAENKRQYDEQKAYNEKVRQENLTSLAPWRTAGTNALATLEQKVNAGPGDFVSSPGEELRRKAAEDAINRAASSRGQVLSPKTTNALAERAGEDQLVSYQNFLANYYNSLTPYQNLSNAGLSAATGGVSSNNQLAATNSGLTSNESQINTGLTNSIANQNYLATVAAGNAQAGGQINQANAWNSGLNNTLNNSLLAYYMTKGGVTPTTPTTPTTSTPAIPYTLGQRFYADPSLIR